MSMFGFGKNKKKLAELNEAIERTNTDIAAHQEQREQLERDAQKTEAETKAMNEEMEREHKEQKALEAENEKLAAELEEVEKEVSDLRADIDATRKSADDATVAKEIILKELAQTEEVIKKEHEAAELSAKTARTYALQLQAEQDTERKKWEEARAKHEAMQRRFEERQRSCQQARADRNEAKNGCTAARDELRELQKAHRRLEEEHKLNEERMEKEQQRRVHLERELQEIDQEQAKVSAESAELEAQLKQRRSALAYVQGDLGKKRAALDRELQDFQQRFQEAKEQKDRNLSEHAVQKEALSALMPDYFNLQTEHTSMTRQLESQKRKTEQLNWEHHKVHRDLDMLAKSYESGILASTQNGGPPGDLI